MAKYKDVNFGNFVRRVNRDGSIDSICTHCYKTVGTGTDSDLDQAESDHKCSEIQN